MSFFAKIEQFCASFIERAFAKTFPSDLEPAQIARKLVSTMEAQTRDDDGESARARFVRGLRERRRFRPSRRASRVSRARVGRPRARPRGEGWTLRSRVARHASRWPRARACRSVRSKFEVGAAALASASFRLRTVEGVPPDGVYSIEGTSRIGRSEESEIVLLDPSVSRAHAVVEVRAGEAIVRDLGSTNGTFLNGRRIETGALARWRRAAFRKHAHAF